VRPLGRLRKWARRRPAVAGLAAAVVLVATLGFGLVTWKWREAKERADSEKQANRQAQVAQTRVEEARRRTDRLVIGLGYCAAEADSSSSPSTLL
jgi:hypothetical protein